jgi:hypothetical protein
MSVDDIAVDCVGTLLERNADGRFVQLERFFARIPWQELSEEELLAHTRRLVVSHVQQEFARLLKDLDPSLEKLRRNLRLAARRDERLTEELIGGTLWLVIQSDADHRRHLPPMPWEFLEELLAPKIGGQALVPETLDAFVDALLGQDLYRRGFPLTALALTVRTIYARREQVVEATEDCHRALSLSPDEVTAIIVNAVTRVAAEKRASYVGKKKITPELFDAYAKAVRDILVDEFVGGDDDPDGYFAVVQKYVTDVSRECYRANHRHTVEYLVKLSRLSFFAIAAPEL